ncbi:MAG TPA: MoxR family ATPase [Thermoanaerobaculia bacterium]|nr:MoxR family ATPase [Thermoanaerobaculia bacterium]
MESLAEPRSEGLEAAQDAVVRLRREVARAVVGQDHLIDRLIVALMVRGHVIVEGVPGLAKTLAVKTLASAMAGSFKRIQFTPDLLPADVTGTLIFDPAGRVFTARFGPVFANLVLADEINRAPAKVQSALLEAMQERQVTIGDRTHPLPDPFVVIATQNPIDHEGTYSLPEAQVDRFLMKVVVRYPSKEEEGRILAMYLNPAPEVAPVTAAITLEDARELTRAVASVHLDERISRYIVELVTATRSPGEYKLAVHTPHLAYGASPRATLAFAHVARGHAFLEGRNYVVPEDIKDVAHDVLRHRLLLTYEAAAEAVTSDQIIDGILSSVSVP